VQWHRSRRNDDPTGELSWETAQLGDGRWADGRETTGDTKDGASTLKSKSNRIAVQINTNALTTLQAKMAYESFYIPAMRYSLPITSINHMDLDTVQAKAMMSLLATMGYN
jgi:hypothetical protein